MSFQESREPVKIWNLESAKPWSHEPTKLWNLEPAKPWSHEPAKLWNLKPTKPWSREPAKLWNLEPAKPWSRESVKTRSHEPAKLQNWGFAKFGNLLKSKFGSHGSWRFPWMRDSWISKKPSQRRYVKKSGFDVWTSGKLVNVWDVKDSHVHVHIWNIP
jgi:hypothetical protein